MPSLSGPVALHSWTLGAPGLAELLAVARTAGYDAVEINWQDIARAREAGLGDADIAALISASQLEVAAVGVEPGWLFAEGEAAERLWKGFRDMAVVAAALDCGTLMSAVGRLVGPPESAKRNMRTAARLAASFDQRLAIEFNFGHPVLDSLDAVRDVVRAADTATCGLVLDTYHLHRGGHPGRGFAAVAPEEILLMQLSDVPERPYRSRGVPLDRLAPGRGTVHWHEVFGLAADKGYAGCLSYEAPNPDAWVRPQGEVAAEGLSAIRGLLREAAGAAPAAQRQER